MQFSSGLTLQSYNYNATVICSFTVPTLSARDYRQPCRLPDWHFQSPRGIAVGPLMSLCLSVYLTASLSLSLSLCAFPQLVKKVVAIGSPNLVYFGFPASAMIYHFGHKTSKAEVRGPHTVRRWFNARLM